jgi:hypothetical protein
MNNENHSIKVLQSIFIWGRKLAYESADIAIFQGYFDDAEYIAGLMARLEYGNCDIQSAIKEMASKYGCYIVLEQYKKGL